LPDKKKPALSTEGTFLIGHSKDKWITIEIVSTSSEFEDNVLYLHPDAKKKYYPDKNFIFV